MSSILAEDRPHVTAGIDTHRDVHVVTVLDSVTARHLDTASFPTTAVGLDALEAWVGSQGCPDAIGIEGTGSYGAGLARQLTAAGHKVVEVDRPDRKARRLHGKSDTLDAEAAARSVLAGTATGTPKARDGNVEAIRVLMVVRRSATRDRTRASNQFHALVLTAPTALRDMLMASNGDARIGKARRFAAVSGQDQVVATIRWALRELARRICFLDQQIAEIDERLTPLVLATAPGLLGMHGVGVHSAAQLLVTAGDNPERLRSEAAWAHLCGAAPVPASSGNTTRHRLNRGGDRQANAALHRIVLVRHQSAPTTKDFIASQLAAGKSQRDAYRKLKRYLARQTYKMIINPPADLPPDGPTLRNLRKEAGLPMRAIAEHAGCSTSTVGAIERQKQFNTDHARRIHEAVMALT